MGAEDSPTVVTAVESVLERELSTAIMRGGSKPKIRKVKRGKALVEQGQIGEELYLVLDGVLVVEVDGRPLTEVGPGVVLGERRRSTSCSRRTGTHRASLELEVGVERVGEPKEVIVRQRRYATPGRRTISHVDLEASDDGAHSR